MNKTTTPTDPSWLQAEIKTHIWNTIAHQKAKSRSTGWTTADNVLASYTLWEARLGSDGLMVKCVASAPTSSDFSEHIKKKAIKARLEAQPCAPSYVVERRDKGHATKPNVAYAFHFQR